MARDHVGTLPRRALLKRVAAASAAAVGSSALAGASDARAAAVHREALTDEATRAFLGPVAPGATIDRWRVEAVRGVRFGSLSVVLRTAAGARFQVDVLRREAGLRGVGETASLSLFVANAGDGATATDEEKGLGAMALAAVLAEREAAGARAPALLSLTERNARFANAAFSVLA